MGLSGTAYQAGGTRQWPFFIQGSKHGPASSGNLVIAQVRNFNEALVLRPTLVVWLTVAISMVHTCTHSLVTPGPPELASCAAAW